MNLPFLLRQGLPVVSRSASNFWTWTIFLLSLSNTWERRSATLRWLSAHLPFPHCACRSLILQVWRRLVEIEFPEKLNWKGPLLGDMEGRLKQVPEVGALCVGMKGQRGPVTSHCVVHLSVNLMVRQGVSRDFGHVSDLATVF